MKSITFSLNLVLTLTLLIGASFFMSVGEVEAKQVSWNTSSVPELMYFHNNGRADGSCGPTGCGWASGIKNTDITVSYYADIYDQVTNNMISDNATIQVGTQLEFRPTAHKNADISWFGTGYSVDTPYGHWVTGAGIPAESNGISACSAADYVSTYMFVGEPYLVYTPVSVSPPNITYTQSGTAGLSCNAAGNLCTVNSAGSIDVSVDFGGTSGKFYYRYYGIDVNFVSKCYYNNVEMREVATYFNSPLTGMLAMTPKSSPYILPVPARSINFTLTAVGGNTPPTVPVITGPVTGTTNISYPFNFTATDPDGDTLRYEIDWNGDGVMDEATSYVPSGTTAVVSKSWATIGDKEIRARALDDQGGYSAWSLLLHTITISAPVASMTVTPTSLDFGDVNIGSSKTMQFTVNNGPVDIIGLVSGLVAPYSCTAGCTYSPLNSGATQVVDITFTPTVAVTATGITDFSGTGGIFRPLTGVGVTPLADCNLPWGGTIVDGVTATAYDQSSVVAPSSCDAETRTCSNGTLSGSYINQTCSVTVPSPAGNISFSPAPCAIAAGASTANCTVNWNSFNFINSADLVRVGVSSIDSGSAGDDSGSVSQTFSSGTSDFELYDGLNKVAVNSVTVGCEAGTVLFGGICTAPPSVTVVPVSTLIRSGDTADVNITVHAGYNTTCTLQGAISGVSNKIDHDVLSGGIDQTYLRTTSPLTSATIVLVTCVGPTAALTTTQEARIEVVPTYQEV